MQPFDPALAPYPLEHVNAARPRHIISRLFAATPGLTDAEGEAFAALRDIVDRSDLLAPRPAWDSPAYNSKPITNTRCRLVDPSADFQDFISVTSDGLTASVIKKYVATVEGDITTASIQFRLRFATGLIPSVVLTDGTERNKTGANEYPCLKRPTHVVVDNGATLTLQVRNTGGLPRRVLAALFGWTWSVYAVAGTGEKTGLVDTQAT